MNLITVLLIICYMITNYIKNSILSIVLYLARTFLELFDLFSCSQYCFSSGYVNTFTTNFSRDIFVNIYLYIHIVLCITIINFDKL